MNNGLEAKETSRWLKNTALLFIRGENVTRAVGIVVIVAVALLIPDTMINLVADFIVPQIVSGWGIAFFLVICSVSIVCQHYILTFVRQKSIETRAKDPYIKFFYGIVTGAQYLLISIIAFVMLKILLTSEYPSIILFATTSISFLLTIGILGLFATKFFSWYKSNRNSLVVLLYGLSFILNALAISLTATTGLIHQYEKDPIINSLSEVVFPSDTFEPGSFFYFLWQSYQYIDMASFALFLAATAVLLHHYSRKLGKVKFWIVVILPLLYRSTSVIFWSGLYTPSTDTEYFYFYLLNSVNATAGGILFAFAFRTVARTIRQDSPVKDYMMIAAYGLLLVFISTQPSLSAASYPPYGISTVSFLPLASLMIFLGLYSTAISVSQDNKLRSSIRKMVTQDSNLLSSIGTAQMDQEIQRTVNSMKDVVEEQEKELEEQTGIEANLEEDEMKKYLEEVMQEVGKAKNHST